MTFIHRVTTALGVFLFALSLSHTAYADVLTPQQVERFVASMPELNALGEKYGDRPNADIDPSNPLVSSLKSMDRNSPEYRELSQLAGRHGFSHVEQWADVGDRTMKAYMLESSGMSGSEFDAMFEQGLANVMNDPALTEAQKAAIVQGMQKTRQRTTVAQVSEEDRAAVRPHMGKLDKLFNE